MPAPRHRNKPSKARHHHSRGFEDEAYLQQQEHSTLPSVNDIKHVNDEGSDDPDAAAAGSDAEEQAEEASSSSSNIRLAMWDLGQCDKKRCTGEIKRCLYLPTIANLSQRAQQPRAQLHLGMPAWPSPATVAAPMQQHTTVSSSS